jgi:Spy/CpxP family protein refolding chaperone
MELRLKNAEAHDQIKQGGLKLAEVLLANPDDVEEANKVLDAQVDAERLIRTNNVNATAAALKVLTPEQRGRFNEFMKRYGGGQAGGERSGERRSRGQRNPQRDTQRDSTQGSEQQTQ